MPSITIAFALKQIPNPGGIWRVGSAVGSAGLQPCQVDLRWRRASALPGGSSVAQGFSPARWIFGGAGLQPCLGWPRVAVAETFDDARIGIEEGNAGAILDLGLRELNGRPCDERAESLLGCVVDESQQNALAWLNAGGHHELGAGDRQVHQAAPLSIDDHFHAGF